MSTDDFNLDPRIIKRDELYDLVWEKPILILAKEFGLSDRGLTKLCARHNIPTPPRGYWAKKEANQKVRQIALPSGPKQIYPIVIYPSRAKRLQQFAPIPAKKNRPIIVIDESGRPYHKHVRTWRALAKRTKVDERGLVSVGEDSLSIFVSKKQVDRASRIVDALIQYFEPQGSELTWQKIRNGQKRCGFKVGDEFVAFKLEEQVRSEVKKRKQRSEYGRGFVYEVPYNVYHPTGKFTLSIDEYVSGAPQRNWSDGKRQKVETILAKFVMAVMQISELKRIVRQRDEERQAVRNREQERIANHRAAYEAEMLRIDVLNSALCDYESARRIREFIDTLQSAEVVQLRKPLPNEDDDLSDWLLWASGYADWLDPTVDSPPGILDTPP